MCSRGFSKELSMIKFYLKANKVLTMSQSAFQKLYSTITSLTDSTDNWYENIYHKQLNLAISIGVIGIHIDLRIISDRGKSLMWSKKRRGPKHEPSGM